MSDHHARAVDAPREVSSLPHQRLRAVLAAKVGMLEMLCFIEHLLGEYAPIAPGRSDGAHEVETAGAQAPRELQGLTGALDVELLEPLGIDLVRQVVERREMKKVLHLPGGALDEGRIDAEILLREIALDSDQPRTVLPA